MQSTATKIEHGQGFAEVGTITHDGHEYTNNGAYVDDQWAYVYVQPNPAPSGCHALRGIVTDWQGNKLGTYRQISTWLVNANQVGCYHMEAIRVRLEDGREYSGRYNRDWSDLCKCKRVKS